MEADATQEGLVPASYLTIVDPLKQVKAVFGFDATSSEELGVTEDEELLLYVNEQDWSLVGRLNGHGIGYVPSSYLEVS